MTGSMGEENVIEEELYRIGSKIEKKYGRRRMEELLSQIHYSYFVIQLKLHSYSNSVSTMGITFTQCDCCSRYSREVLRLSLHCDDVGTAILDTASDGCCSSR